MRGPNAAGINKRPGRLTKNPRSPPLADPHRWRVPLAACLVVLRFSDTNTAGGVIALEPYPVR